MAERLPKYQTTNINYTQEMDGYALNYSEGDINSLNVEILDDYVVLETERWAATPDELRQLAHDAEILIQENEKALEDNAKANKPEYLDVPAFERRRTPPKVDSHPAFTNPHTASEEPSRDRHTESPDRTGADDEQD